ncbi:dehydrogenase [Actinomycetospora sp. NBRC 106375]|uniref:FAD-binding oxidoreductase n=1 Tax=Actinomycetospora sp. NBRC 106375 TaxID=3032207 RepID=UPI0024A1F4F3|nr:FAD-linked oxidase C-terminal domain-containing protein [Actinomycetospora sp. NBRC 106375]GLZ48768.1 dehydrogenase [Actinomycetospora sp. NBRC 106375]
MLHDLVDAVGAEHVVAGDDPRVADLCRDEALGVPAGKPAYVVWPAGRDEVAAVVRVARAAGASVTARGAGTGLSGAATPDDGAVLVSFARMDRVIQLDPVDAVAVVQPGVTLGDLDAAAGEHGLTYPVHPGELSASVGGTVATNAGGMRAVRYGVTRAHVLGLEAVLADGSVARTGGRLVKVSSGYDLTQLLIGSEGTLALVTEVVVRLHPQLPARRTVLAPFRSAEAVTAAVGQVLASGLAPSVCEYLDGPTMRAVCDAADLTLGLPDGLVDADHLLIELAGRRQERVDEDAEELAELLGVAGAADVFDLAAGSARRLVEARERAFWAVKAAGADEIVDLVVPRSAMATFLARARAAGDAHGARVLGCGHAGDGNVHLAVFQPDPARLAATLHDVLAAGVALGGAISGEHGVGRAKAGHLADLGDPVALDVVRRVRAALDPEGTLNPGCGLRR